MKKFYLNSISLSISSKSGVGKLISEDSHIDAELTDLQLRTLKILLDRGLHYLEQNRVLTPGSALLEQIQQTDPKQSDKDLLDFALESVEIGGDPQQHSSAEKWLLQFLSENEGRPRLAARVLLELKARQATVRDFFTAFVFSGTDNIQANLDFLDYLRCLARDPIPSSGAGLSEVTKAIVDDLRLKLSFEHGTQEERLFWSLFEKGRIEWDEKDFNALYGLKDALRTGNELLNVSALAGTFRPSGLYHYYRCLSHCDLGDWHHVITTDRRYSSDALKAHYRVLDISRFNTLASIDDHGLLRPASISHGEVRRALKSLPLAQSGGLSRGLVNFIEFGDGSAAILEEISEALNHTVPMSLLENKLLTEKKGDA